MTKQTQTTQKPYKKSKSLFECLSNIIATDNAKMMIDTIAKTTLKLAQNRDSLSSEIIDSIVSGLTVATIKGNGNLIVQAENNNFHFDKKMVKGNIYAFRIDLMPLLLHSDLNFHVQNQNFHGINLVYQLAKFKEENPTDEFPNHEYGCYLQITPESVDVVLSFSTWFNHLDNMQTYRVILSLHSKKELFASMDLFASLYANFAET